MFVLFLLILSVIIFKNKNDISNDSIIRELNNKISPEFSKELSKIIKICNPEKVTYSEEKCTNTIYSFNHNVLKQYGLIIQIPSGISMCLRDSSGIAIFDINEKIDIDDIIAFTCTKNFEHIITHRIIDEIDTGNRTFYITKGDNLNNQYEVIHQNQVAGKLIWSNIFTECKETLKCDINRKIKVYAYQEEMLKIPKINDKLRSIILQDCIIELPTEYISSCD